MKFYTSDLHFGHKNAITMDDRPFASVEEMDKTLIDNWNSVVGRKDEVYILGDMFWKNDGSVDILKQLKGQKFLILGNHDRLNADMKEQFVWIKDYATIKDNGFSIVLFHYPIAHWRNADYGAVHLFGHIHSGRDTRPFEEYKVEMLKRDLPYECYNVGTMLWNYHPVTLKQIRGE